jgi:hypothetical protein
VTLIVAGRIEEAPEPSDAELIRCYEELREKEGEGLSRRDMADRIARDAGVSRRRIYRLLILLELSVEV